MVITINSVTFFKAEGMSRNQAAAENVKKNTWNTYSILMKGTSANVLAFDLETIWYF